MTREHQLALLNRAAQSLAEVNDIGTALEIHDKAEAIRHYCAVRDRSDGAAVKAAEIKLRAARRVGELLPPKATNRHDSPKLASDGRTLDLPRQRAAEFRKLAAVPQEQFEAHVAGKVDKGEQPSQAQLLREHKKSQSADLRRRGGDDRRAADSLDALAAAVASGDQDPFGTIYLDPPWGYSNQGTRGATDNHYPTMSIDDIAGLPVAELSAAESHIHLWTTSVFLPDAFGLLAGWGFSYKSYLVWDKPQFGLGNYWRGPCELLILGTKGNAAFLRHDVRGILREDRTKHSRKPDAFRQLIETVSPGPRLEMFARQTFDGWVSWGNEIETSLFHGGTAAATREERNGDERH